MFGRDAPGFDELEIDWGPASSFGPDDDPGTPMTHQDSSESDELRSGLSGNQNSLHAIEQTH